MTRRALEVLSRLPAHLEAARPGKQFQVVADAVARLLDELAARLATIRRAHRLGHADTPLDIGRLGALHAIGAAELAPLEQRERQLDQLAAELDAALEGGDPEALGAAAAAVLDLFALPGGEERLALFTAPGTAESPADLAAAGQALHGRLRDLLLYTARRERRRRRVRSLAAVQARGNATVRALLEATASALGLELDLERNRAIKQSWRPRVVVTQEGPPGTTTYAYRVVARSRTKSVDRLSEVVVTGSGAATLDDTHASLLSWTPPPDARDLLVFRVANGAAPEEVGLLTPVPLDPLASSFRDAAAQVPAPPPGVPPGSLPDEEIDDELFHSRDRFWHASAVRQVERLVRLVAPPGVGGPGAAAEPARRLTIEQGIPVRSLAATTGATVERVVELAVAHGVAAAAATTVLGPEEAAAVARDLGFGVEQILPAALEFLGLEENPLRREVTPPAGRAHGELFPVYRRGFGRALLQILVTGIAGRSVAPMLVNRDEGHGIGFSGAVADGAELVFDEAGRVTLDGTDVTALCFAWRGACFAGDDDDPALPRDFVWDGPGADPARRATFAAATPAGALDASFVFPHAGEGLPVPGVGVGRTRFAFFVQQAHWAPRDETVEPPVALPLAPRTRLGYADGSLFAAGAAESAAPAATVSLSWLEHEAHAVRVILPRRFALFDREGEETLAARLGRALERHRAAGVELRVETVEDRWTLGESDVGPSGAGDPILSLRGGSLLWEPPEPPN